MRLKVSAFFSQVRGAATLTQPSEKMLPISAKARRCRKKFLAFFPGGFADETYLAWEREYKWKAHQQWNAVLSKAKFVYLLRKHRYGEISGHAVRIESRTNLLFSFEKIALRDALKSSWGARLFSRGLFNFLHGAGPLKERFEAWCDVVNSLPRKQTRVLTWPILTVFGFIAQPQTHLFLKPNVTRLAAAQYGFDFKYQSRPAWTTYASLRTFAATIQHDLQNLVPRDMIDIQSFIWVQGSDEY